jgi:hypothetical protein
MPKLLRPGTGALRRQIEPEWIELKPDGLLEKCARKICEAV